MGHVCFGFSIVSVGLFASKRSIKIGGFIIEKYCFWNAQMFRPRTVDVFTLQIHELWKMKNDLKTTELLF